MTRNIIDAKINLQFDNLKINLIMLNHSTIEWNYPKHSHGKNFYEVHYIDGGKGKLVCEDKEYPLENGVLAMTGPLISHEQQTDVCNPMRLSRTIGANPQQNPSCLKILPFGSDMTRRIWKLNFILLTQRAIIKASGIFIWSRA